MLNRLYTETPKFIDFGFGPFEIRLKVPELDCNLTDRVAYYFHLAIRYFANGFIRPTYWQVSELLIQRRRDFTASLEPTIQPITMVYGIYQRDVPKLRHDNAIICRFSHWFYNKTFRNPYRAYCGICWRGFPHREHITSSSHRLMFQRSCSIAPMIHRDPMTRLSVFSGGITVFSGGILCSGEV